MGAEYELKYRATPQSQSAVMAAFPGAWSAVSMQTTYYDTPSGALSDRRYMLRSRLENGTCVCTVKTPGRNQLRGEWEIPCIDITAAVPALCRLGAPEELLALCREGLIPVCGAAFQRQVLRLTFPGGSAELALDQGRLFGKCRELPLCEIELELKSGTDTALAAFAADFARRFSLCPEDSSKFARALALNREV